MKCTYNNKNTIGDGSTTGKKEKLPLDCGRGRVDAGLCAPHMSRMTYINIINYIKIRLYMG